MYLMFLIELWLYIHVCDLLKVIPNWTMTYYYIPTGSIQYFTLIVPPFREAMHKFCTKTKVRKTWVSDHQALEHQSINVSFCNNTDLHQTRQLVKMQATIKMQDSQSIRTAIKWGADRRKVKQDEARRHTTTISWQGKSRNMWCWGEIYD